jgi:hypothetical protein
MALCITGGRERVVMAEQLVGAVDEVNFQREAPESDYQGLLFSCGGLVGVDRGSKMLTMDA